MSWPHWVCPCSSCVCFFPVYTVQALGCSARNCLRWALGCMHFPGLSCSGSGTPQRHRLGWACVLCTSQVRAAQVTRCLASAVIPSWGLHLIASPAPAARFSGCTTGVPSQVCRVCLFWGADLWLRPSRQMSTIQNPKKSWLVMKPAWCLVEDASLGPQLPLPALVALACLSPVGDGLIHSRLALLSPLFCEWAWQCLRLGLFAG